MEKDIREDIAWAQINKDVLGSLEAPRPLYWIILLVAIAMVGVGVGCEIYQYQTGIGVANMDNPHAWGLYIATFIFWIGMSHSGTLLSAILHLMHADWRKPIYRFAEAMTTFSLMTAGLFVMIHLGRLWQFYYSLPYPNERGLWPNFQSPLLWDAMAIFTYLSSSIIFLYIGMIPDLAICRDNMHPGWRKKLYTLLSLGWEGTDRQWRNFRITYLTVACFLIPLAVSVHSIVAWDFAVTVVPGWHSTIFPPYFVIGAITSGVAAVISLMIIIRRAFHLEEYLTPLHFDNMGKLLLVICLLWSYAYFVDVNITWYAHEPIEWEVFSFMADKYTPLLVLMLFGNSVLPITVLCFKKLRRNIGLMLAVSVLINVCMFIERYLIIVPSLSHKNMPFIWHTYFPSWVEMSIAAAAFAGFALLYTLFAKYFPIMAVTDVRALEVRQTHVPLGRTKVPSIAGEE